MKKTILRFIIIGLSLFVADWLLDSVEITSNSALIISALLLGLANAILRPILIVLTLPITILSLGLFLLVINVFMYWLVSQIVPGFELHGWQGAILGALVTGITASLLESILKDKNT